MEVSLGARVKVELDEEQATTLKIWSASGKAEQRMALRAKVILFASLKKHRSKNRTELARLFKVAQTLPQSGRGRPQTNFNQ